MKFALTLILSLAVVGCTSTSKDLQVYREAQHAVSKPLFDAHLLLIAQARAVGDAWAAQQAAPTDPAARAALTSAVSAVRRDGIDLQAVQMGAKESENLYATSKAHDAGPATQPAVTVGP